MPPRTIPNDVDLHNVAEIVDRLAVLGQRQLGSAILRGDRQLSKAHVVKLGAHFGISPSVFLA
jgi:antitoxin component HigA of HigAB toxin-antitoxin module